MTADRQPRCVGFGEFDGKCDNKAGSFRSKLWCERCDKLRIAHINARMDQITASFRDSRAGGQA